MAILRRSEAHVTAILAKFPSSLYERNSLGQTPLQLACGWPPGIKLLLAAGSQDIVDRLDNFGWPAFTYASIFSCLESLELLFEADCSLFPLSPPERPEREPFCLAQTLYWCSEEVSAFLIQSLAARRGGLKELALDNLPLEEIEELNLRNDTVLDGKAHVVYAALKANGVDIPNTLSVPSMQTSVYHLTNLRPECAEQLYDIGFRDVDIFDHIGLTPLMYESSFPLHDNSYSSLRMPAWLLSHGADLNTKPEVVQGNSMQGDSFNRHYSAAHFLAAKAGLVIPCFLPERCSELDAEIRDLLSLLYSRLNFDNCSCGCSSRGCCPGKIMWKELDYRSRVRSRPREELLPDLMPVSWVCDHLSPTNESWCWLSFQTIRSLTFDALDIRHTCCQPQPLCDLIYEDEEEIKEIREEDRFRLQLLEELVEEFEFKYAEYAMGLMEFLEGYWSDRMKEVLNESTSVGEEDIRRIEEIGVIIGKEEN
jgi:hypothetical protein